jgi:hypothetical protein
VVSPLLANVYLHEALDKWFAQEVVPRLRGRAFLVRYADDFVIVSEFEHDARRILQVLTKRLARFGLTLHPDKTRLVDFRRPPPEGGPRRGTFDLLGFTHHWGKSRKRRWTVKRKTAKSRFSRAVKQFTERCRQNRHLPLKEQHRQLCEALEGHDAYYGITGNWPSLDRLRHQVCRIWLKWLGRRSRKAAKSWEWYAKLLERHPLPPARVVHTVYGRQLQLPLGA